MSVTLSPELVAAEPARRWTTGIEAGARNGTVTEYHVRPLWTRLRGPETTGIGVQATAWPVPDTV